MGRAPKEVFSEALDDVERIDEEILQRAFLERDDREVRSDPTLQFEGTTWEVDQRFLRSRTVEVCRSLRDPDAAPWIECEGSQFEMYPVDPKQNADRARPDQKPAAGSRSSLAGGSSHKVTDQTAETSHHGRAWPRNRACPIT